MMSPLAKKLLVKPGQQWLLVNPPTDYLASLDPLPDNVTLHFEMAHPVDGIQLFIKNSAELSQSLHDIQPVLKPETILWFIYPKKNSGIDTDLEMMGSWNEATKYGLRPVASAAVNNIWTALRFRPESLVKVSGFSKAAIKANDHSAYIDTDHKIITLPAYLDEALSASPAAMDAYHKLAWSHRKEYVIWVLSAKQESTRISRITNMVEKLLAGKKNPGMK